MTREEKIAKARELRAEGLTYRAIADQMGISLQTAYRWLNPEYAEKSRAISRRYKDRHREEIHAYNRRYNEENRGRCPNCGGEMDRETARRGGICEPCHTARVESRGRQIEEWWTSGLSLREIADRLGWSRNRLGVEMHRLRAKGFDLPYRHRPRTPRFPEQVPA